MDLSQNEEIQKDVEKLETIQEETPKEESEQPIETTSKSNSKAKKRAKKPRTKKQVEAFQKMIKKRKENLESKKNHLKNGSTKAEVAQERQKAKEPKADDVVLETSTPVENHLKNGSTKAEVAQERQKSEDGVLGASLDEEKPKPKPKPKNKPQPKPEIESSDTESETDSDTDSDDGVSPPSATDKLKGVRGATLPDDEAPTQPKRQPKKSQNNQNTGAKMKVFTHDNVRRQVNRPNMSNREYQSGYSRETIEKAKQELKRNRSTSRNKMTQRNNIANRRFDSSIFK